MEPIIIVFIVIGVVLALVGILLIISKMRGNIKLVLSKTQFAPGEEVTGNVALTLKKPTEAKFLRVGLIGVQRTRNYSSQGTSTQDKNVFEFYQDLDGQKIYPSGTKEYPISLKIPSDIINQIENPLGKAIVGVVSALTGASHQTKWYIISELEVSGFNIKKKVQINIY